MNAMMFMGFARLGFFEMLLLLVSGGGMGLPLSVPPQPFDPVLARVAPEQCLFYTAWAGVKRPDAASQNETERMLAEPEVRHAVAELERVIRTALVDAVQREGAPPELAQSLVKWGRVLLTSPAALYVADAGVGLQGVTVDGGVVVKMGEQVGAFRQLLVRLQTESYGDAVQTIELDGHTYYQLPQQPGTSPVVWGTRGKYLIVAVGHDGLQKMFQSFQAGVPSWLAEMQNQLPVQRVSTATYIDLARIFHKLKPLIEAAGEPGMLQHLGMSNITSYRAMAGLDSGGFVLRQLLTIDGELTGLWATAVDRPLTFNDLQSIPGDASAAMAMRLDARKLLDGLLSMLRVAEPRAAEEITSTLDEAARELGFSIRDDLLGSLGDLWYLYASPTEGGLITGWTAGVQINDYKTLNRIHQQLIDRARAALDHQRRAPRIGQYRFGEHDIYYLQVPDDDMPFVPSWCLTPGELVVALYPQAIKAHLAGAEQSLAHASSIRRLLESDHPPLAFCYYDTGRLFELAYPLAQLLARYGLSEARKEGVDVDISILPSPAAIAPHLRPGLVALRRTDAGLESVARSSLPSGTIGSSVPLVAAALLPAISSARGAARRAQSMNNLRQIALAIHVYADAHRGLPAAYSTNKDGKPLLSWRVHILPYLEQQALYEQFHLDEPWDSPHNRKLIAQMPDVYRSPASQAEPGKTNYLAVVGNNAALTAPRGQGEALQRHPTGTRFADFTDGTSNTIMVLEVSDERAVVWTRPADFEPSQQNVAAGVKGLIPDGFLAAMADGSVRFLSAALETETLRRLLIRNDGKPVQIP